MQSGVFYAIFGVYLAFFAPKCTFQFLLRLSKVFFVVALDFSNVLSHFACRMVINIMNFYSIHKHIVRNTENEGR